MSLHYADTSWFTLKLTGSILLCQAVHKDGMSISINLCQLDAVRGQGAYSLRYLSSTDSPNSRETGKDKSEHQSFVLMTDCLADTDAFKTRLSLRQEAFFKKWEMYKTCSHH